MNDLIQSLGDPKMNGLQEQINLEHVEKNLTPELE